jgi:hypothetical protein
VDGRAKNSKTLENDPRIGSGLGLGLGLGWPKVRPDPLKPQKRRDDGVFGVLVHVAIVLQKNRVSRRFLGVGQVELDFWPDLVGTKLQLGPSRTCFSGFLVVLQPTATWTKGVEKTPKHSRQTIFFGPSWFRSRSNKRKSWTRPAGPPKSSRTRVLVHPWPRGWKGVEKTPKNLEVDAFW